MVDAAKYTNCFRVFIEPGFHEEQRIEAVKEYCLKYSFQNVMLFINNEERNLGHMTIAEAEPIVAAMKRAKAVFERAGISVSLNPWITIGHLDRGRTLKEGQNFGLMRDKNGKETQMVACPLSTEWRAYIKEFYSYLLKELKPEVIWIEDDFRLHNHDPLEWGGCFCDEHIARYNAKLPQKLTRDEFVKELLRPGEPTAARKAWLDVSRETMSDLAEFIGNFVKDTAPETRVGLMSSNVIQHALEARDWRDVTEKIRAGKEYINRIHLPCYMEMCAKEYYYYFNQTSMAVRTFLPENTLIYPELENGAFSPFAKSARFLKYQLESALPLCTNGMTYDIFDFTGNGVVPCYGYGETVRDLTPYFQAVCDEKIAFSSLKGVVVPVSEKSAYCTRTTVGKGIMECAPSEYWIGAFLGSAGISYRYSAEQSFENQLVALCGQVLRTMSTEQIERLFADNKVILDGEAAATLFDMGLGRLCGIRSLEKLLPGGNVQAFEQAADFNVVCGIENMRATCLEKAGTYVNIEYDRPVREYTVVFNNRLQRIGSGIAVANGKTAVFPFVLNDLHFEQLHEVRIRTLADIFKTFATECNELLIAVQSGVSAYLYAHKNGYAAILVNSSVDSFGCIELEAKNIPFNRIRILERGTNTFVNADYSRDGEKVTIRGGLEYLSSAVLLFEE